MFGLEKNRIFFLTIGSEDVKMEMRKCSGFLEDRLQMAVNQQNFLKINGDWQPQAQHPLSRVQAWGWLVSGKGAPALVFACCLVLRRESQRQDKKTQGRPEYKRFLKVW